MIIAMPVPPPRAFMARTETGFNRRIQLKPLTLRRRIKSHLLFAGIIRSSPFSPR